MRPGTTLVLGGLLLVILMAALVQFFVLGR
jgi:hypothetical protein